MSGDVAIRWACGFFAISAGAMGIWAVAMERSFHIRTLFSYITTT